MTIRRDTLAEVIGMLQKMDDDAYANTSNITWDPELYISHAIGAVADLLKAEDDASDGVSRTMHDDITRLNGKLSIQVAQNGVGFYNNGKLFWQVPIETASALAKELPKQLKRYGVTQ